MFFTVNGVPDAFLSFSVNGITLEYIAGARVLVVSARFVGPSMTCTSEDGRIAVAVLDCNRVVVSSTGRMF